MKLKYKVYRLKEIEDLWLNKLNYYYYYNYYDYYCNYLLFCDRYKYKSLDNRLRIERQIKKTFEDFSFLYAI